MLVRVEVRRDVFDFGRTNDAMLGHIEPASLRPIQHCELVVDQALIRGATKLRDPVPFGALDRHRQAVVDLG
ncbi:MAG: hypothetical protein R6X02_30360 [Enhygromyxa sp.]